MFLTDVRVPDANRVGEPGSGWRAVLTTLMSERRSVGVRAAAAAIDPVNVLIELARHLDRAGDPSSASSSPTRTPIDFLHPQWLGERGAEAVATGAARGGGVDPQAARLEHAQPGDRQARRRAARPGVRRRHRRVGHVHVGGFLCGAPALRIAGGTDEIQHNILGDRVLGLPREPS